MKTIAYKITLTEEMLGTKPSTTEVFTNFVAAKKRDAMPKDEMDAAEAAQAEIEQLEKGMTVFHRSEDGAPIIWNYEWKGFLKDSIKSLRRDPKSASAKVKAYKSIVDGCVFVEPRKIKMTIPEGAHVGICERPLRAMTMQGERVSLAKSETVPAGTTMEIKMILVTPEFEEVVDECMTYGAVHGIGQWRNSGKGTFTFEKVAAK